MDFAFTDDQVAIKDSVARLCAQFDGKYWLKKDKAGGFPEDFYRDRSLQVPVDLAADQTLTIDLLQPQF